MLHGVGYLRKNADPDNPIIFRNSIIGTSSEKTLEIKSKIITALKDPTYFAEFVRGLKLTYGAYQIIVTDKYPDVLNFVVIGFLLAICLFHSGNVKEATELRAEVLKCINSVFSKHDENFLTNKKWSLWSFQDILNWRRNQAGALAILQQQYPETESLEHNLGLCLLAMGRFAEAKIMLKAKWKAKWKGDNLEGGDLNISTLNSKRLLFYCITQIPQQRELGIKKLEEITSQYESLDGEMDNNFLQGTRKVLEVVKKNQFTPISPGSTDGFGGMGSIKDKLYCPQCNIL